MYLQTTIPTRTLKICLLLLGVFVFNYYPNLLIKIQLVANNF